jgi:rsbT co-antagonist protein RsbR
VAYWVAMVDADGRRRGVSPFAVIEVDGGLQVVDWDDRAAQEFGPTRGEAIGRSVAEVVPVAGGEAAWRGLVDGGDEPRVWQLARAGDGRVFEWRRQPVVDADGRACGAVCFGVDVTAREARAGELQLHSRLLRAIHENLDVVVWALDRDTRYVFQKGRACVPGPDWMVGKTMEEIFHGGEALEEAMRRVFAGETLHSVTAEYGREWETWMIPVESGGPAAVVGVSLDVTDMKRGELALREKLEVIERQQQAIRAMSTPIIEVWEGVLTLPILGLVDSVRTAEIMDNLLQAVTRSRARFAVLDMTGVEVVDTSTAGHLLGMIRAIRLLGAEGIITGVHPNIAQTMVTLGVDLSRIVVHANLREALKYCIGRSRPRSAATGSVGG